MLKKGSFLVRAMSHEEYAIYKSGGTVRPRGERDVIYFMPEYQNIESSCRGEFLDVKYTKTYQSMSMVSGDRMVRFKLLCDIDGIAEIAGRPYSDPFCTGFCCTVWLQEVHVEYYSKNELKEVECFVGHRRKKRSRRKGDRPKLALAT